MTLALGLLVFVGTGQHTPISVDPGVATIQSAWINAAAVVVAAVIGALVAALVAVIAYRRQKKDERRERLASTYADAIQAVVDYCEAPYRILRRDGSQEDRTRLTIYVSDIQARLARFETLIPLNSSATVARSYKELVTTARREAGSAMTEAWNAMPTRRDRNVPINEPMAMPTVGALKAATLEAMQHEVGQHPIG